MGSGASKKSNAASGPVQVKPRSEVPHYEGLSLGAAADIIDTLNLNQEVGSRPLAQAKVEDEDIEAEMAQAISRHPASPSAAAGSSASLGTSPARPPKGKTARPPVAPAAPAASPRSASPKSAASPRSAVSPKSAGREAPKSGSEPLCAADLHAACRSGDAAAARGMLKKTSELDEETLFDEYGDSVLHHAAHSGELEILKLLLEKQVQVDIPNARNETALSVACRKNHTAMALQLLKAEANPNRPATSGLTPVLAAFLSDASEELLEALVENKADLNVQDHRGVGALHSMALSNNLRLMNWLIDLSAELDLQTEHGTTALMLAARRPELEGVKRLLEAKANPNLSNKAGSNTLMQAFSCNLPVAQLLLDHGASVEMVDSAGRSALFHAVTSGEPEAVQAVIQRGGRVNILDEDARTPLYQACLMGSGDLVKLLLAHNADPNLAGRGSSVRPTAPEEEDGASRVLLEEARTCLQISTMLAHNELMVCLLEHSADLNAAPGNLGWSALHLCAVVNNEEGASLLLRRGVEFSEDIEGNTAKMLAERAGHERLLELLAHEAAPARARPKAPLPPLAGGREQAEAPELAPLESFKEEWAPRAPGDSLLDRVFGPMVHDAMLSSQWRHRWEAYTFISRSFAELGAEPRDLIEAVSRATCMAARDKIPKVFHAALSVLEELLSTSVVDEVSCEDFAQLLHSEEGNMLELLLDQTDVGGGSSNSTSPQQAAANSLCSCVLHGRVSLDEAALPLFQRIDERLRALTKDESKIPKCLAANLKLLGRILTSFGLQQSGLFRRALLLPLLLRAAACEQSKVRAASGDCLLQLLSLSGGMEERLWDLLPPKAKKRIQSLATGHEGIALLSATPCDEDAMAKEDIVAEEGRASGFLCVSELNSLTWSALNGESVARSPKASDALGLADEAAAQALVAAFSSKNWKQRAESVNDLAAKLAAAGEGVKLIEGEGDGGGPLLSQYVLCSLRISLLQTELGTLLADTVTAVFVSAADLLRLVCSQVPLYIAPLFLEPLLPSLVARLLDTSQKVRHKALETTLEVCALHGSALSEMVACCVSSGSAWSSASEKSGDRSTGPRLQLLTQMVQRMQDRDSARSWSDDTWSSLCSYALKAAENKSETVRKQAASLLEAIAMVGGRAGEIAEHALGQVKAMAEERQKQKMRPGTGVRPLTGRTGTASSRPGTGALGGSGRLSNMGSTFSMTLNSTGRLSTANRSRGGASGSFRPGTGRPGTGSAISMADESDNSVHSDAPAVEAEDGGALDDGVKFFDVVRSAGGADAVPEPAEGEAALKEALPLAEALDEVALDFVAPLIALFGEGWTRCFYSRNWQCRVAALTHLSAVMAQRLEATDSANIAELLDGCMRAVHEGLGDQNVRVYAEACMSVTAIVPAFCGTVDGRLLVAHLAPLLRQLCARMGDSKEAVRTQTTQAIFRLMNPPTGNIVSPVAIAMLILRHLTPMKEEDADSPMASVSKGATGKGATTGWLCRIGALRDLCKEYSKSIVQQPGSTNPGEWLRLADGLKHSDPYVRHESVRLYALVCKMHLKPLGDEEAQRPAREIWVAALPKDVPGKSVAQVRKYLKLPDTGAAPSLERQKSLSTAAAPWQVPPQLATWAGCPLEALAALCAPQAGDEKAVIAALKALGKGKEADKTDKASCEEAFSGICRAIQQALAYPTGNDRFVFLTSVELCQSAVQQLGPSLSGLDLNMALAKVFPTLMERTAMSSDVKVGVSSDKLVQQLAKHPKVGCEAVTKMVIASVARSERPSRPLVLLRTLLGDFGLRLCAQKDVVLLLLQALATQLENEAESNGQVRAQLVAVLATCNQFSSETVRFCLSEVEVSQRKPLLAALAEAPDSKLMALGAAAAEEEVAVAGSAVRAASRSRGMSPLSQSPEGPRNARPAVLSRHTSRNNLGKPPEDPHGPSLRRSDSGRTDRTERTDDESPGIRDGTRSHSTRRRRRIDCSPQNEAAGLSASTAASTEFPSESPRPFGSRTTSTPNLSKSLEASPRSKPPAPMNLSTALKGTESASWKFKDEGKRSKSDVRFGKDKPLNDLDLEAMSREGQGRSR